MALPQTPAKDKTKVIFDNNIKKQAEPYYF